MATSDEEYRNYAIAHAVMLGLWIPTLFIIWVISLFMARRRGDPARIAFTMFKSVPPPTLIYLLMSVVSDAAYIALYTIYHSDDGDISYDGLLALNLTGTYSIGIMQVFHNIASALLLLTLVELGNGFMYARSGQRSAMARIVRYVYVFLAVVFISISIAASERYCNLWVEYYRGRGRNSRNLTAGIKLYQKLWMAHDILHWIAVLPTIAYAAVVVYFYRAQKGVRGSAVIFLIATVLNFIRFTYIIATDASWYNPNNNGPVDIPVFQPALDAVFISWMIAITLVLLFVIGIRKQAGLWSTQQPFHGGMAPVAFGAAGGAKPAPMVYQAPVGYQAPLGYQAPVGYQAAPVGYQAPVGWQPQQSQPVAYAPQPSQAPPATVSAPTQ